MHSRTLIRIAATLALVLALAAVGCGVKTQTPSGTSEPVEGVQNPKAADAIPAAGSSRDAAKSANEVIGNTQSEVDAITEQQ